MPKKDLATSLTTTNYQISPTEFQSIYKQFLRYIKEVSGQEFMGFGSGYLYDYEHYKYDIREESLKILDMGSWSHDDVGKGDLVDRIIQSIELEDNNLVITARKYGPDSFPHSKLIEARKSGRNILEIEQTIFDHFSTSRPSDLVFSEMTALFGRRYSLVAFLYYLKDDRKYLPISPSNFENAFGILGFDLKLQHQCSWGNYIDYLNAIKEVQYNFENCFGEDINFLDAHSFLWVLTYKNRFIKWLETNTGKDKIKFEARVIKPINLNKGNQVNKQQNESTSIIDFLKIQQEKRAKGRRAEEYVFKFEKQRLSEEGFGDLVEQVKDCSTKYGLGYDIKSFSDRNTERHIEVKSSSGNSFIITRNELLQSKNDPVYWIYVVNDKGDNEILIKMISAPELEDDQHFQLEPKDYYVSFGEG